MNNEVKPELSTLTHDALTYEIAKQAQFLYESGPMYGPCNGVSDRLFELVTALNAAHSSALAAERKRTIAKCISALGARVCGMDGDKPCRCHTCRETSECIEIIEALSSLAQGPVGK